MTLLEKLGKGLASGFQTASNKTSEYTKIGRAKLDIIGVKKEIEEQMLELGGRVYDKAINHNIYNFEQESLIKSIVNKIQTLEVELKEYEKKISDFKELNETTNNNRVEK